MTSRLRDDDESRLTASLADSHKRAAVRETESVCLHSSAGKGGIVKNTKIRGESAILISVSHFLQEKGDRPQIPPNSEPGFCDLMKQCWDQEPSRVCHSLLLFEFEEEARNGFSSVD